MYIGETLLGETPLELSADQLTGDQGKGSFLRLEKTGYKRVWLWLPKSSYDRELKLNINPFFVKKAKTNHSLTHQISPLKLNELADSLLLFQSELLLGNTIEDQKLDAVLKSNPYLASAHFLASLQSMLKNDQQKAQEYIQDAVRYNSQQTDFQMLLNEIAPQSTGDSSGSANVGGENAP